MQRTATISPCHRYRYRLGRVWDPNGIKAVFIMLNPGTADHEVDDASIRKCVAFAKIWGCGSLELVNLSSFRAKKPLDMTMAAEPIGADNKHHFREVVAAMGSVV